MQRFLEGQDGLTVAGRGVSCLKVSSSQMVGTIGATEKYKKVFRDYTDQLSGGIDGKGEDLGQGLRLWKQLTEGGNRFCVSRGI